MQTFLPVPHLWGSATLLDRQRLGKQRVETYQIMQALTGLTATDDGVAPYEPPASVAKHWVTALWRGHEAFLLSYQGAATAEWTGRGYRDTCWDKTRRIYAESGLPSGAFYPGWWGDPEFHLAHQARLVAKDPLTYAGMFPDVEPIDDYDFKWRN